MDLTTDKGQPFARATPVSTGFGETTGRQFHEYPVQPPRGAPIFRVFSCLLDTANAPVVGCNGAESNKGVPHVGAAPHSPKHTDSCSSIAWRAAGEAFPTITEAFRGFPECVAK